MKNQIVLDKVSEIQDLKIKSLEEIAKHFDIHIMEYDMKGGCRGFFVTKYNEKVIVINSQLSRIEKREVGFHELAHALLHSNYDKKSDSKKESEANLFAALFLIKKEEILELIKNNYTIDMISSSLNVSSSLVKEYVNTIL